MNSRVDWINMDVNPRNPSVDVMLTVHMLTARVDVP
jgi:hypothetical protein